MLQQRLNRLRDFILQYNIYFNKGYADAVMNEIEGSISSGQEEIFPADQLGNYFYLRLPQDIVPDYADRFKIADNALSIGLRYDIILVAVVEGADSSLLLENMMTTIGRYTGNEEFKITKVTCNPRKVCMQELAKIGKENIEAAIQRLPQNAGMCSVHFTFTEPFVFQQLNCIQNPCKTC